MEFLKKNLVRFILITFLIVIPLFSFAQPKGGLVGNAPSDAGLVGEAVKQTTTKLDNPIPYYTLNGFIKALLEGVLKIGIPIIALAIIYSGFLFVFARGNSEKLTTAKDALLYTLIGAAILLGSWAIATLISDTVLGLSFNFSSFVLL